ncbi:homocysteine S-methyltransferase [Corynebacterium terpenotabidum]|uniref:Homocysteine methyltransferase n=1 Tax=Corynebacterium terpenotabidum Y-11 TaxID=1200352 RepID=S4XJD4_9CORY|nr:homocysteine S-methyltransferase [Corynebacterium terpenotabidum]AGP30693.1 homocysteine methyltransferase [Corynebacterium terpenotabidum Y-11]
MTDSDLLTDPLTDLRTALAHRAVVLDGGLGTRLEDRGNDITGALWSAQILRDSPVEVRDAHTDFFDAGAEVATACSYEVTVDGLVAVGMSPADAVVEAELLLRRAVAVARESADAASSLAGAPRWVAASVGPYGAGPGDGTEYDGAYGLSTAELAAWHRDRIRILADTDADVLLAETVPSIREVEALAGEFTAAGVDAMLSVTVLPRTPGTLTDGVTLSDGTDLAEVARIVADTPAFQVVGVNCVSADAALAGVRALAIGLAEAGRPLPLSAYPNSGERWDHVNRRWLPRTASGGCGATTSLLDAVPDFLGTGVRLIGGCCRVTPREITAIAGMVAPPA